MSGAARWGILAVLALAAPAAADTRLRVEAASRLWIEGTTNLHGWRCGGGSLRGELRVTAAPHQLRERLARWQQLPGGSPIDAAGELPPHWQTQMELRVPVGALACGNRRMEGDLRAALQAAEHPEISYRFVGLRAARYAPAGVTPAFELTVEGAITLAGRSREVLIAVTATRLGTHHFRLRGSVPLRMTDFGIAPPVALLGLIRAADAIVVGVELELAIVEPDGGDPAPRLEATAPAERGAARRPASSPLPTS